MQIVTQRTGGQGRVVAALGPTNTGKTHLALERMLGHDSGMIGFPLRLLARENYDRACRAKGRNRVALITGEEKIIPPGARYFLCTVESMPVGRSVAFLGVDEIQMCADPDRGHLFTDRLLHARGTEETMFMGAETIRPLIRRLVPEATFISRPRMSTLTYTGPRKVSRLPRRTAVVAFTAADVYALAELLRRQRGGAAVVLGALSPRTRNAQVAMYQAGEVDYLVATDAIGMGLNMDVDHVAFAATQKFDGRLVRTLSAAEMAQIAGRAGRHMNDGSFGTTGDVGRLEPLMVERIANHRFEPLRRLFWRNADLDVSSLSGLQGSLAEAPDHPGLMRARPADDELALAALVREPEVAPLVDGRNAVRLLWEVCQIPDYRKVMSDAHARLLAQVFRHLRGDGGRRGRLPTDWVAKQVARIDRVDGDIEALVQRIADVRTWTYVAYRGDWLHDAAHWQGRTRDLEDKLSDALHDRLTQRFVDRRSAALVGRIRRQERLLSAVTATGEVIVEGHAVGRLEGFRFVAEGRPNGADEAARTVAAAAQRALREEIGRRIGRLEAAGDDAIAPDAVGRLNWEGAPVARLVAGASVVDPRIAVGASELLTLAESERVRKRLAQWLTSHLEARLDVLFVAGRAPIGGVPRGLVYQVTESLGSLARRRAADQVAALSRDDRQALRSLGLRIGRESVFFPGMLRPATMALRGLLWAVREEVAVPPVPPPGRTSVAVNAGVSEAFYEAVGFRVLGPLAVRMDIVERLAGRATRLSREGAFAPGPELTSLLGCGATELAAVLGCLGYTACADDTGVRFRRRRESGQRGNRSRQAAVSRSRPPNQDSPFAKLRDLALRS